MSPRYTCVLAEDLLDPSTSTPPKREIFQSSNSIAPRTPYRIPLETVHTGAELGPGEEIQLPFILHAAHHGERDLSMLLVFREVRVLANL